MKRRTDGIALVVTLVLALVLFIAIVAITTTLSISNRQTSSNQTVAVRAQFSAESGLNQADQKLVAVANLLNNVTVDLGAGGNYLAAQDALFQDMYRYCYGSPATPPAGAPLYPAFAASLIAHGSNPNFTICAQALPINAADTDASIATNRMQIFMDSSNGGYIPFGATGVAPLVQSIDNRAVSGTTPNLAAEQRMWANLARGSANTQSSTTNGYKDAFVTAITLAPVSLLKQEGKYVFLMGKPTDTSAGVESTGLVQATDGSSVANRILTRSSLMSTSLQPPSFARFAFFYNSHYLNGTRNDTTSVVKFRNGFKVNGPIYTNGNFVFESNAPQGITFAGEVGSAGCDDGAATFYANGTQVTGTPTSGASISSGCVQRSSGNRWSGTPRQGYYLDGMGNYKAVATSGQSTAFDPTLKLDTVYQDDEGNQLCGTVSREYYGLNQCPNGASDASKARKVDWNHAPIPLPSDGTAGFQSQADSGGLFFDTSKYSNAGSTGNITLNVRPSDLTVPSLDQTRRDSINLYTGTPSVYLSVDNPGTANQLQHVRIVVAQITGYSLSYSSYCYVAPTPGPSPTPTPTPTPNPPGDPGAFAPRTTQQPRDASLPVRSHSTLLGVLQQVLTAGNNAFAAGERWTVPNGCAQSNERYVYAYSRQTANRTLEFTVAADKSVNVLGTNPFGSLDNNAFSLSAANFNGVIYSSGDLNLDSASDQADRANPTTPQKATRNLPEIAKYSQLSVAAGSNVWIKHDITYAENPIDLPDNQPKPTNMLGIYGGSNVYFNSNNKTTHQYDDFNVNAVIMAQNGSVANYQACDTNTNDVSKGNLNITGSVIQNRLGAINCKFTGRPAATSQPGYIGNYQYDGRTGDGLTPPAFPTFTAGNFTAQNNFQTNRSFIRVVPGN